jgi:hypothetical protein
MSGWNGETGEGPQCLAMVRGHEVLHHLDLDLRSRSGVGEVLRLYHHLTDCFYQEVACLHRLGFARRNLGFLLHHLPRNTVLLPTIWTPTLIISGAGTCAEVSTFVIIGHVATVSTILTDLALVVVPAIMLWNTQMKRSSKIQAFCLLSFASIASVITMVRIPYVNKFEAQTNLQCK